MKLLPLFMCRDTGDDADSLQFYNVTLYPHTRPATPEDETLEALADMLDLAAEDCNAHDFVLVHRGLAAVLLREVGRRRATRILRRLVNYEGLHGLTGVCGEGDVPATEAELRTSLHDWSSCGTRL